ncbi:hypothetical protein QBD00_004649 [Ochrobactrum sp. AN78]|nr:hypothetical protein [Ochrobactrum sp. AN78]
MRKNKKIECRAPSRALYNDAPNFRINAVCLPKIDTDFWADAVVVFKH